MFSLDCDEMTVLQPNDCIIMSFYYIDLLEYQMLELLWKKFFDWMCSSDCDEMIVLWTNDFIISSFYYSNIKCKKICKRRFLIGCLV